MVEEADKHIAVVEMRMINHHHILQSMFPVILNKEGDF